MRTVHDNILYMIHMDECYHSFDYSMLHVVTPLTAQLEILAIGQQLEGTGNVSAEIVSLVRIDNSNDFIVTVNTNSTESPERLTQIVTEPLTEQFEEFSDIIQAISFNVQRTERHGKQQDLTPAVQVCSTTVCSCMDMCVHL